MNSKGYIDFPATMILLMFIVSLPMLYSIYKSETDVVVVKVLDYKVDRCIIPHNGTGPFVITEIKDGPVSKTVCVKNYPVTQEEYIDYSTNINFNAESCMPIEFWDNMIVEYKWDIKGDCNE